MSKTVFSCLGESFSEFLGVFGVFSAFSAFFTTSALVFSADFAFSVFFVVWMFFGFFLASVSFNLFLIFLFFGFLEAFEFLFLRTLFLFFEPFGHPGPLLKGPLGIKSKGLNPEPSEELSESEFPSP